MANELFIAAGTATVWTDSGGDKLMDMGGLAADALVMGAFLDLGAGARSQWYELELFIDGFNTAPAVGAVVAVHLMQSNATTNFDGNPTSDPTVSLEGTITEDQAKNGISVPGVRVYSTTAGDELKSRYVVRLVARYVSPVVHNKTAVALLSTADAHTLTLTPIPTQLQG